jgi:hypothetical protein
LKGNQARAFAIKGLELRVRGLEFGGWRESSDMSPMVEFVGNNQHISYVTYVTYITYHMSPMVEFVGNNQPSSPDKDR